MRDVNELFEFVLSHFRVAHRHGDTAQCFCPIHRDKTASLTVTKKIDRIVVFCHAGCQTKDVLAAVGLTMKDLFLRQINRRAAVGRDMLRAERNAGLKKHTTTLIVTVLIATPR